MNRAVVEEVLAEGRIQQEKNKREAARKSAAAENENKNKTLMSKVATVGRRMSAVMMGGAGGRRLSMMGRRMSAAFSSHSSSSSSSSSGSGISSNRVSPQKRRQVEEPTIDDDDDAALNGNGPRTTIIDQFVLRNTSLNDRHTARTKHRVEVPKRRLSLQEKAQTGKKMSKRQQSQRRMYGARKAVNKAKAPHWSDDLPQEAQAEQGEREEPEVEVAGGAAGARAGAGGAVGGISDENENEHEHEYEYDYKETAAIDGQIAQLEEDMYDRLQRTGTGTGPGKENDKEASRLPQWKQEANVRMRAHVQSNIPARVVEHT
jgi:hypothetical protein